MRCVGGRTRLHSRKGQQPSRLLAASLLVLYLWTPYLNVLPLPAFAVSPPDPNTGNVSLPSGTVTNLAPAPKLAQSQDFDFRIHLQMLSTSSGCIGDAGCLTWVTPQGNLTFSKDYAFAMSYSYFGTGNNSEVSFSAFGVKQAGAGLLVPGASVVRTTDHSYEVNTTEWSAASNTLQGNLDVRYDFSFVPFKATATYTNHAPADFHVFWIVAGHDYVTDPITNSTSQVSSAAAGTNVTIGQRAEVYLSRAPSRSGSHTLVGVRDAGNAMFAYGSLPFPGLGAGDRHYHAVEATFATDKAIIDPVLMQENFSTCSYPCSGPAIASFSSASSAGDILVVTVVSDDLTVLTVTDTLGTKISRAVNATSSGCDSNSGSCQADIFWGVLHSSGLDAVTVSEGTSSRALRVQIWEFSGVVSIDGTVSCSPSCGTVSYPSNVVLIATARDAYGAGAGFSWSQYSASGVAGSEYEIAASSGSTQFPFSIAVNDVEAGAVLLPVPPPPTVIPPWGEPGLSPYESYLNNAAVYVSLGNGLVSVEQPTFSLTGRDLAVAPTLFYEEPGAFGGNGASPFQYDNFTAADLGYGWSLDFPWLGANDVHLANGQQYAYLWNGGRDMQVHGPVDFELTSTSDNGVCPCRLLLPSGVIYSFDSFARLVTETDPTGKNTVQFSYGQGDFLSTITDSVGRVTSLGYARGLLATITAPGGRTWSLSYSGHDLTAVVNPVGDYERFSYEPGNPWLLASVTYAAGGLVALGYGSAAVAGGRSQVVTLRDTKVADRSVAQSDSISYLFNQGVLVWANMTEADGSGAVQGYVKDHYSLAAGVATAYSQNAAGSTTRAVENDFTGNRLTATKTETSFGAVMATTSYLYDDWGNVVYSKDNNGHETWFSYDQAGSYNSFGGSGCPASGFYANPTIPGVHSLLVGTCTYQDSFKLIPQETFNEYNANAELIEQKTSHSGGYLYTDYTYDGYGNVLSIRDANGNYAYDEYSPAYNGAYLTAKSTVADGQSIIAQYSYDFNTGFMTSATDPNGGTTSKTYDALGRALTIAYPAVGGASPVQSYFYDDPHGLVTITDPRGGQTKEYFDGLGRMVEVQAMNGTSAYSTTFYAYNWLGKEAAVRTPLGFTYSFSYDQAGRPTKETFPDGTSATATYNDDLNVVTIKDQDGHETFYGYSLGGRLISVEQFSSSSQHYVTTYVYDGNGDLLLVGNNIKQLTNYRYDDLNRVTKITGPDGNFTAYAYDNLGNLVSKMTPNGATIAYAYDQASRLTSASYPDGSQVAYSYDPDGNTLTVASTLSGSTLEAYTYDAMNRLSSSSLTVSGGTYATSYSYDANGNPVKVTYPDGLAVSRSYDALNRLKSVGNYATFAYNQNGGITSITFGDGEVQAYAYDSLDRPTSIVDSSGNKKLMSLSYAYDGASNIVGINKDGFTYDNMSRVTSTKAGGGTQSYTYDGAGNILSSAGNGKNSATVYKNCGFYPNTLSGTVVQCGTDKDGNIVSKTGGWVYSFNFEDEMVAAALNGVTQQTNLYDGLGNRVEKTESGTSTVFTYQSVNLLFEKDLATGTTTDHIYGDGMQLAKVTGGTTYYYHEDQVGSNQVVTYVDPHGKVGTQFSSSYEPYGANYKAKGSETFQYTDRMLDSATGLYYCNARFYDPSTMRFMSADPLPGNPHAYAGDNPLTNIDPTGLDWWNPTTWTSTQWLLVGAAALTAASVLQLGLDPITDALAGADIAELLGSAATLGAAATGLPLVIGGTEDVGPDLLAASAVSTGVRLTNAVTGEVTDLAGYPRLGAHAAPGTVGRWGEGIVRILRPAAQAFPKVAMSLDKSIIGDFLEGTTAIDSKVGTSFDAVQAQKYADAGALGRRLLGIPGVTGVGGGVITKAEYYLFQNPETGAMPRPSTIATLNRLGIGYSVYFTEYY